MTGAPLALDWRLVPAGPFTMGSDPAAEHAPDADEAPRHTVYLDTFRLGRTPVTNAQYRSFVAATGRRPPACWPDGVVPKGRELHPVTYVSWHDADAFCGWAGGALPTEAQWERAARGDDARTWPWGDRPPTSGHAVTGVEDTRPVGGRREGAGPFGHLDLAGNAWEWTSSLRHAYPYDSNDGREAEGDAARVLRGGAFIHGPGDVRSSSRFGMLPGAIDHYVGFRLAAPAGLDVDGIDLLDVPAGRVVLGNDPRPAGGPTRPDEAPQAAVDVAAFELTATPVTNEQYGAFVRATGGAAPTHWNGGGVPDGLAHHPVTHVDRDEAAAFCAWAGGRLPTEAEWEKGARGLDARRYPWGEDEPGAGRANAGRGARHGGTAPVGASPSGASPYGLLDMAGNVWEWVSTAYRPYPYRSDDGREDGSAAEPGVLRGGSFASLTASHLRCARRSASWPGRRSAHIGFRVARDATRREKIAA
ncbi:MAG TPA: SUMF1/EgtB/PvdO family nonheme iron enzyme [Gaiella sp.]|uniref:formylglycine-generating enzyme family protein n=1 Tax=Gaiella sp. TaxID=2663207 RepID=UPI002D7F7158|nr:SUMF1/EgtB/PvdO family nonheme iron enzyme [Gaiella sp.]HET9289302.1 SUMF1/EgtB/PvdO family nonheme iron enzyme [Gaiella sp.]